MLCTIDTQVGGVATDQKTRAFNFWNSFVEIVTASAGSTPVNNPVNTSGVRDTNYNCITVISNTEAGGWSESSGNFYNATATYNASQARAYADVYRSSGKSTYPWYRVGFTNFTYPYSSSFTTYPGVRTGCGCTSSDPATTVWESAENDFKYSITSPSTGLTTQTAIGDFGGETIPENMLRVDKVSETFYVAATQDYIIITTNQYLWYFGIRTVAPWENSRTDNPPWVHFAYTRTSNSGTYGAVNNHAERVAAFSSALEQDNLTQRTPQLYGQYLTNQQGYRPITGSGLYTNSFVERMGYVPAGNPFVNYNIIPPIINTTLNSDYGQYAAADAPALTYYVLWDAMVTDSATGLAVPPAYPVTFRMAYSSDGSAMGQAPGIYKGPFLSPNGKTNFITAGNYTIGGDSYVPVYAGHITADYRDLWFLRSA
jgi:hypothetical protein